MPALASEGPPSSLGGGTEEVIIAKLSISPKQSLHDNGEVADALHLNTRNFDQTRHYTLALRLSSRYAHPTLGNILKGGCINGFAMVWRMAKRGQLIAIAVSIAILLSAFGLPVTANGPQNSGQSNPGGYVKYTLDLLNNTLINGNFVNTGMVRGHGA